MSPIVVLFYHFHMTSCATRSNAADGHGGDAHFEYVVLYRLATFLIEKIRARLGVRFYRVSILINFCTLAISHYSHPIPW